MENSITSFSGEYAFLSNFYASNITSPTFEDNNTYPSAEHAYQAHKSILTESRLLFTDPKITPGQAKKLGQKVVLRENWESIKVKTMERIVYAKFNQYDHLVGKLLDTYPMKLVEGNHWGDCFWGVYKGHGQNHLGEILMRVREDFIQNKINKNELKLPYDFDLLFDIKTYEQVEEVVAGEYWDDVTPEQLKTLFIRTNTPVPNCLKNTQILMDIYIFPNGTYSRTKPTSAQAQWQKVTIPEFSEEIE